MRALANVQNEECSVVANRGGRKSEGGGGEIRGRKKNANGKAQL